MRFTMIRFLLSVIVTIIISNPGTLCTAFYAARTSDNVSIVGGYEIDIEHAPFMVSIVSPSSKNKKSHPKFCGGSIIHERFILTSAHCLSHDADVSLIKVHCGSAHSYGKYKTRLRVKNMICHEHFSHSTKIKFCPKHFPFFFSRNGNDICLLELTKPVKFGDKVGKVVLPPEKQSLEKGTEVKLTGWGATKKGGKVSEHLRQVEIPIISKKDCTKTYKKLSKKEICAGSPGHDACEGDSGGPLTHGNVQIGIVSYGKKACECGIGIGVYTSVLSHLKWIKKTIGIIKEETGEHTQHHAYFPEGNAEMMDFHSYLINFLRFLNKTV